VLRDLRFAIRLLVKDRAFTCVAVTVLGLGLAVANTQFVLLYASCLRGLPVPRVDRVLFLGARDARSRDLPLSFREFDDIARAATEFAALAAFANAPMVIGDEDRAPDRVVGTYVSAAAFGVLGETPAAGRGFGPDDDRTGAAAVAILGDGVWKTRYAADPTIVGRTVRVNGVPTAIIGIARAGFRFPSVTDIWLPLAAMPGIGTDRRTARALSVIARMNDETTITGVRSALEGTSNRLSQEYPDTNQGRRLTAAPINERYNGRITDPVWLAFIGVGVIVLLIACANAANLLLMRAVKRSHEMALRASLGASRRQLIRQLLAESAVLAAAGGVVATVLSVASVRMLTSIIPENTLAYYVRFTMDGRVFAVLCAVSLGTVFVFGLAPAVHVSKADVNQAMKEGARGGSAGVGARRWTTAFLTAECALTMVMLAGLVLGIRVSRAAGRADAVIDPKNLVTTWLTLSSDRYRTAEQRIEFYRRLDERLAAVPAVSAAAATTALPLGGATARQLSIDGQPPAAGRALPTAWTVTVSARYFETMGVPLLRGRAFGDRDGARGYESAIVNQRLVDMFFPDGEAVGRRIRLTDANTPGDQAGWLTIVGIAPTVRQRPLPDHDPIVYVPLRSAPPVSAVLVVRTLGDPAAVGPILRDVVRDIDRDLPLYRVMSMERALLESQWNGRISNMLLNGIAFVAVLLAAIGLYAVSAHAVAQRTQEIGVRVALGASSRHVIAIVARRAAIHLALGLVAGVAATLAFERLVGGGPGTFGYHMAEPVNLAAVAVMLTIITALASVAPARRALRLDPVIALRHE
jgi:predicted permease